MSFNLGLRPWGAVVATFSLLGTVAAQTEIDETLTTLEQWVEQERVLAEAEAQWEIEEAMLQDLIAVRRKELEALNRELEKDAEQSSAADERRGELLEQQDALAGVSHELKVTIAEAEGRVRKLAPLLPPPLRSRLSVVLNAIPQEGEDVEGGVGRRYQNVVAILQEVEKWQNDIYVEEETRTFGSDEIQVDTLYLGLGAAYFVDASGAYAGVGRPTAEGWTWQQEPAVAERVRTLVDIIEGGENPSFISLPVNLD